MTDTTPGAQAPAQVATPAQEPSAAPEVKQGEQSEQTPTPEKEEMVPLKRLNRMRAALGESERQKQAVIDKLAGLEKQVAPKAPEKPVADNYSTPEEYAEALADFITQEKQIAEKSKGPTPEEIAKQARDFERNVQTFKSREAAWMKENPGYEAAATVVNDFVSMMNTSHPAFKAFETAVFGSEKAPQVIQFLGENPKEIARLARLGPVEVGMAMEDIIESLGAPEPQTDGPDEETPDVLPAPPTPIKGNAKAKKSLDSMSGKELLKQMESLRRRG